MSTDDGMDEGKAAAGKRRARYPDKFVIGAGEVTVTGPDGKVIERPAKKSVDDELALADDPHA